MTLLKYIGKCLIGLVNYLTAVTMAGIKEFVIAVSVILLIIGIFIISLILLNWIFALIITIGGIVGFCVIAILIELIINKIKKK